MRCSLSRWVKGSAEFKLQTACAARRMYLPPVCVPTIRTCSSELHFRWPTNSSIMPPAIVVNFEPMRHSTGSKPGSLGFDDHRGFAANPLPRWRPWSASTSLVLPTHCRFGDLTAPGGPSGPPYTSAIASMTISTLFHDTCAGVSGAPVIVCRNRTLRWHDSGCLQ